MSNPALTSAMTRLLLAGSILSLLAAEPGIAQTQPAVPSATPEPEPVPVKPEPAEERNTIVVIGGRTIIAVLKNATVEASYDEDAVASYGVGSVGEVLDEIRRENGDDQPSFLINGRPVNSPDEIAGLPSEAIARIEVLPKGSATQIGGNPGQRAYNVVLRPSLARTTLTASREEATEGGWSNSRGEALFTLIKGQDRLNLSIRGGRSSALLESERNYIPRTQTTPYSAQGNIIPLSSVAGAQIDPALTTLAGQPITVLALLSGVTTPTLAGLLQGANRTNPSVESQHRTLRGPARPIDINLAAHKQLNDWLSLSFNARLGWTESENGNGLPSARFVIPASNPNTPFGTTVVLALNDPNRPLVSRSVGNSQAVSTTLNAQLGPWRAAVTGKWDRRANSYVSQFTGPLGALGTVGATTNPFDGRLAATIPVSVRESTSRSSTSQAIFEMQGPTISLWAGPINTRGTVAASWIDYRAEDLTGPRSLKRTELTARAGITLPLTSKQFGFLPQLGESELEFDYGAADLGSFGKLTRRSLAFNWQPAAFLRLTALDSREERSVGPELLAAPVVVTPNVPYFDPLTGQTTEVTLIYGGVPNLDNEDYRIKSVAVTFTPLKKYGLQFDAEYAVNEVRNQVGALPPPSSAVVEAFPDRFVRDSLGYLTIVDSRSINFARQRTEALRVGFRFVLPLTQPGPATTDAKGRRTRTPPLRLAFSVNHSILLDSTAVIRIGLPEVDLLKGGAIGIGGGQLRHNTRASLALTRGGSGLRLDYARRGSSALVTGTPALPDLLEFAPLSTLDLKAFVELDSLFPKVGFPRGTRVSLTVDNLFNQRQLVTDQSGLIPQAYQPLRRDPIGRTVMAELRIAF